MEKNTAVKSIIDMWPSKAAMAEDVSRISGKKLKPVAVIRWAKRNSIPSKYDAVLVMAAAERNISLSLVDLMNARSVHIDQRGHADSGFQETSGVAAQ